MNISLGDLVKLRNSADLGIVVDVKPCNEGLDSAHISHVRKVYPSVFYVYFSKLGKRGPYYEADLSLYQSAYQTEHASTDFH